MNPSEHPFKLNGMKIILDLQGLPDKLCDGMKRVKDSPWLTIQQKVNLLDNMHKKFLTDMQDKTKISDRNHL